MLNKLHHKKKWPVGIGRWLADHLPTNHLPTTYWPPTDYLPTTYQPPTDHLPTTNTVPPTDHLPTTYWPPTDRLLTTYQPPTDHLLTTYQPPTLYHLLTTYQPPTYLFFYGAACSIFPTICMLDSCVTFCRLHIVCRMDRACYSWPWFPVLLVSRATCLSPKSLRGAEMDTKILRPQRVWWKNTHTD